MPQLEGQHCWVISISQPIFSFLVVALCIRGTDVRSNSNSVHPFIFVRDDPDGGFSISIRVLPYAVRLDDGTVKQYERQDLDWDVSLNGYTMDSFLADLKQRLHFGSTQEPQIWCTNMSTKAQEKVQISEHLLTIFKDRWSTKWVCFLVEIVDIGSSFSCQSSVTFSSSGTQEPIILESLPCEQPDVELIDWDTLVIQESHDEEGRIETIGQDELYIILGLKDEDERAKKAAEAAAKEAAAQAAETQGGTMPLDIDGAAIPVDDVIPEELHLRYDKDKTQMKLGLCYPDMDEFRMAVRQYAINEEFELGTEKSDKKRFRGYCTGEDCPWRIVGNRQSDKRTIMILTCYFSCVCSA